MAFLDIVSDAGGISQSRGSLASVPAIASKNLASQYLRGNTGVVSDVGGVEVMPVQRGNTGTVVGMSLLEYLIMTLPSGGGGRSGMVKVYLAGSWQLKPVKVWSGSAWVTKPAKAWNGSQWVTSL